MWVCGLKPDANIQTCKEIKVAPYVGVWIETLTKAGTFQIYSRTLCGCVD